MTKTNTILKVVHVSKQYRLGLVGTGTLGDDLKRWWYKIRGKEDPFLKVGDVNDRSTKGESNYVWALQDINFEVQQGEVLGIIGKNGAGKSTLLKILSRVTAPTKGEIKTKGRIASLLEVGTGFHPELTGRENIYLNGAILGMTKAEIKTKEDEIIAFSGCERYVDTPAKRYSSGMRVRLAFAVAAFLEPDILVIDEVLAVGDAEFQKKAIGKMQDISKGDGRTVVFVSHDMAAIRSLCCRLLLICNGVIVFEGNVEDGVNKYLKSFESSKLNYINEKLENGINSINFMDENFNNLEVINVGQKICVKVNYLNPNKRKWSISIGFFDFMGNFKFACRSDIINVLFEDEKGEAFLYIDKWPLSEGSYYYNFAVHDKGVIIENKKQIGAFFVERGDFYGTGKLPGHNTGFYIDYVWKKG